MKRSEKEQLVTELREKMEGAKALYYTDFTGLNVKRMTELRRRLRKAGVEYVVIKNTLALRAVNESGLVATKLKGQTGLVIAKDVLEKFVRKRENDRIGLVAFAGGARQIVPLTMNPRDITTALAELGLLP